MKMVAVIPHVTADMMIMMIVMHRIATVPVGTLHVAEGMEAGSVIRKAIRKPRNVAGITLIMGPAAGSGIPVAMLWQHAVGGTTLITLLVAGSVIRKGIPKQLSAVGMNI